MKAAVLFAATLLLLAGCASPGTDTSRHVPNETVTLAEAQADPERARGQQIRWGGHIVGTSHAEDHTTLEIVARPLQRRGEPESGDESLGRFLARVDAFLDPAVYAPGRRVTVAGTVEGIREQEIDEFTYRYPVVRVFDHRLWEQHGRTARSGHRGGYTGPRHVRGPYHHGLRHHAPHPRHRSSLRYRTGVRAGR